MVQVVRAEDGPAVHQPHLARDLERVQITRTVMVETLRSRAMSVIARKPAARSFVVIHVRRSGRPSLRKSRSFMVTSPVRCSNG